ncbi:MAG: amidohydrolase family protein [Pusillimonas sp.]
MSILLTNLALLDTDQGVLLNGHEVLIEGKQIASVDSGIDRKKARLVLDLGGRTLMPGLIDCHVHLHRMPNVPTPVMLPSLITAHAGKTLKGMLARGFTTVRDAGGADAGHRQAVEQGIFEGPRVFVSGRAISQTGGHGDPRSPADLTSPCGCTHLVAGMGRVADGDAEVRRAVRDEIRLGADQIKVMAGGGVGAIADPIDQLQYSTQELEAIVDEARRSHRYVMAHVYTDEGIRRCVDAGIRTIEHGHFLTEKTARAMVDRNAYLSTNLATYQLIVNEGEALGFPASTIEKSREILAIGGRAIDIARHCGLKTAFATDLTRMPERQGDEFLARADIMPAAEIIRSATVIGAEVVRMAGKLGAITPGAIADLLVVDGNPLEDISLLAQDGGSLRLIMKEGRLYKNELG